MAWAIACFLDGGIFSVQGCPESRKSCSWKARAIVDSPKELGFAVELEAPAIVDSSEFVLEASLTVQFDSVISLPEFEDLSLSSRFF